MNNMITYLCLCILMIENSFQREISLDRPLEGVKKSLHSNHGDISAKADIGVRKRRDFFDDYGYSRRGRFTYSTTPWPSVSTTHHILYTSTGQPQMRNMGCGKRLVTHTELITNGLLTRPGDWPWHVALYRMKTIGSELQYICGGTVLSATRVLTAGHCVTEHTETIIPERLFVVLGKYNLAGGDIESQERGVFEIVIHPQFFKQTMANDIAILKLSSSVRFNDYVQPICLWTNSDTDKQSIVNKRGTVVGWGFNEIDALSSQLRMAEMPVAGDLDCIKTNPVFFSRFISDNTFCAGNRNGTSACNGDSGGGMYLSEKDADGEDIWSIRGIVSLSVSRKDKSVCDPNEFIVFTDSVKYLDFIRSNL